MEVLQKSLEEVISTLKGFGTKLDAVAVDVKGNSEEVVRLTKQVDDFGVDLEEIRRQQLTADKAKRLETEDTGQRPSETTVSGAQRHAVLANNGRPLLPEPSRAREFGDPSRVGATGSDGGGFLAKPPKHHFPKFNGEHPLLWIDLAYTYFTMYSVPSAHWVATATLYLEGHAALWFRAYKRRHAQPSWTTFIAAVVDEFGQEEYEGQMSKLLQLKQTGSVPEYKAAFESCMYHLLSLDESLSNRRFVSQFVFGLRDELRAAVRLQAPSSVTRAASLARIQKEEAEHQRPRTRPPAPTKHPTVGTALPLGSAVVPVGARRAATDEYTRERQLRDFRRTNGLCFKCGDKYSKDHQCKKPAHVLMIEVGEFGEVLSDDTVHALNLLDGRPDAAPAAECCTISVHAVSGTEDNSTIRIRAMVGNQSPRYLLSTSRWPMVR
ncbi:uncharacterized protein [Triticum aestivum]|uniref:uncharacterized protein n=1 Tax=Triticum aestivum TaxID=4565 RepID=UPI001D03011D|nr:uncharacterized protein LOC123147489 [Triticum aestivum]